MVTVCSSPVLFHVSKELILPRHREKNLEPLVLLCLGLKASATEDEDPLLGTTF